MSDGISAQDFTLTHRSLCESLIGPAVDTPQDFSTSEPPNSTWTMTTKRYAAIWWCLAR